jgi:cytokinin dehydrogenase
MNRRKFLRTGLGATAAVASRSNGSVTSAQARPGDGPPTSGVLSSDPSVRAAAAQDFGRLIHKQPRAVFRPVSSADISNLMRLAKSQGLKVAARGQGHSIYGRALTGDGIVIDMNTISAISRVQPDRIVVEAGATWASLLGATLAQGLTPPVLTNYLGLSIGGTIAVTL